MAQKLRELAGQVEARASVNVEHLSFDQLRRYAERVPGSNSAPR